MTRRSASFLVFLGMLLSASAAAEIYTWRDEQGVLQYSDRPPVGSPGEARPDVRTIEVPEIETISVRQLPESWTGAAGEPEASDGNHRKVVMYSAAWCGVCKRAKRYFQQNRIRYTEKDIERSKRARREFEKLGGRGVPLILVGRQRLSGFSAASFEQVYRR